MKQILVLFGGCSPEYSVSLASAYGVLTHMDRSLYQPIPVGITREGAWRWYGGALEAIPEDRWQEEPACLPAPCGWTGAGPPCSCWTAPAGPWPLTGPSP